MPDEAAAAEVRAALAADWPERPSEVRIGPASADGVAWDGATVRALVDGEPRVAPAPDAHLAVLLVRTWSIRPELGPEHFVPAPAPLPAPPVEPPPPAPRGPAFAAGAGIRQGTAEPLWLARQRLVLEAGGDRAFVDLAVTAAFGGEREVARWIGRRWPADPAVAVALDRASLALTGGWRRPGPVPIYAWGGLELRAAQWWLSVQGAVSSPVPTLAPAALAGGGIGLALERFELRALPAVRAGPAGPPASVLLSIEALARP